MNNYNNEGRRDLYNREYRINKSRKMKRRRMVFFTFTGLALAAGVFFSGKYVMDFVQNTGLLQGPDVPMSVETKVEEEKPKDKVMFIKGVENVSIDFASTLPKKIDFQAIEPGKNHSIMASSYAYPLADIKLGMKGEGNFADKKIAFLTFDDGPVGNTLKVLDILKEKNIPATFFIPGKVLANYDDKSIMDRYIQEGHGIAIHSYSHDYKYLYPGRVANPERIIEEYDKTVNIMKESLGDTFNTKVFRFPGGAMSWKNIPAAQEALLAQGVVDIDWNSMSGDAEPEKRRPGSSSAMGDFVFSTLNQNNHTNIAMVLMHDVKGATPEYLRKVIDDFVQRGYTFGILE